MPAAHAALCDSSAEAAVDTGKQASLAGFTNNASFHEAGGRTDFTRRVVCQTVL